MSDSLASLSQCPSHAPEYPEEDFIRRLNTYHRVSPKDDTIDFIKTFNKYIPPDGCAYLFGDVIGSKTDKELRALADRIDTGLLRPLKAAGAKTPNIVDSPRWGDPIYNMPAMITKSILQEQEALRDRCLQRDGYQCKVSGKYDVLHNPDTINKDSVDLGVAHILLFPLGIFENAGERRQPGMLWTSLYRYFPSVGRLDFNHRKIYRTMNAMMMEEALHKQFGRFLFAFESTGIDHQYKIQVFPDFPGCYKYLFPPDRVVTFTSHNDNSQLPNPQLLAVHFAVANIVYATGRAELVDKGIRDYESLIGLSSDGRTDISALLSVSHLPLIGGHCPSSARSKSPVKDV